MKGDTQQWHYHRIPSTRIPKFITVCCTAIYVTEGCFDATSMAVGKSRIWKYSEPNEGDVIDVHSRQLSEVTAKDRVKLQQGPPNVLPSFKPNISRIRVQSHAATLTRLVTAFITCQTPHEVLSHDFYLLLWEMASGGSCRWRLTEWIAKR
jgi:hypothetical protein